MPRKHKVRKAPFCEGLAMILPALLSSAAYALPVGNTTVPEIASNSSNPNLICQSGTATSIAVFLFTNYLAHCATVRPYPGDTTLAYILSAGFALFFPSSGIMRAMDSFVRHARLSKGNALEKAAQAGALCMVVRSPEWRPERPTPVHSAEPIYPAELQAQTDKNEHFPEENIPQGSNELHERVDTYPQKFHSARVFKPLWMQEYLHTWDSFSFLRSVTKNTCIIYGAYSKLPPGYDFAYVPSDAKFKEQSEEQSEGHPSKKWYCNTIESSYNFPKTVAGVVQALYAGLTLYQTRGNQIAIYGYAAYGLTVTPYIIMSIINLFGQLVTPDYSSIYMVESGIMDEARARGGEFSGTVGILDESHSASSEPKSMASQLNCIIKGDRAYFPACFKFKRTHDIDDGLLEHDDEDASGRFYIKQKRQKPRSFFRYIILYAIPIALSAMPLVVIGTLSHFQEGSSTRAQRAWVISWLVIGMVFGPVAPLLQALITELFDDNGKENAKSGVSGIIFIVAVLIGMFGILFVPTFGAIVVVVQMLQGFGICNKI